MEKGIGMMSENDLIKQLLIIIGKTHLYVSFKFDETQVSLTINELCSEFKKHFFWLTIKEIEIAFSNGYKKEYGEFFGLCNATYFAWVKAYNESEKRTNAKKAIENSKLLMNPKPILTEEEKEEIVKNGIRKRFKDFKAGLEIEDYGNVAYNYLERMGKIKFTMERKIEIKERTIKEMKNKALFDTNRVEKIDNILEKVLTTEAIKCNSKKNALKEYFKDLIEMGDELEI